MKVSDRPWWAAYLVFCLALGFGVTASSAVTIDLVYEFDGNSPDGTTSFGTVELIQNGALVDLTITADTVNLGGGDIQAFYFNLPDTINANDLVLSNPGGISNQPIGSFTLLGPNPSVLGGAGASFDTGINFGNGGGPPGNGLLTAATFSLTVAGGLLVDDLVTELSNPNNTPPVSVAVHFQNTGIFGNDSETVGGVVPEPSSLVLLALGCSLGARARRNRASV